MKKLLLFLLLPVLVSCGNEKKSEDNVDTQSQRDSLEANKEEEFKVLDSKNISRDSLWAPFEAGLAEFSQE
jgi:amidase